jgi:rubrerythrin
MNVFDFAMQMETDAEAFYRQLASKSPVAGIKKIFINLAEDEKKHYQLFHDLKNAMESTGSQESGVLDEARNVFADLLEKKADVAVMQDNLEGYGYAMKLEADGAHFYEDAARREKDPKVAKLLSRIAEEERRHFNIVENIYRYVNAPNEYLAWVEFSNLDDFHAFGRDVDL